MLACSIISIYAVSKGNYLQGRRMCVAGVDSFASVYEPHTMRQIILWYRHAPFALPPKECGSSQSSTCRTLRTDWKYEAIYYHTRKTVRDIYSSHNWKWKNAHQSYFYRQVPVLLPRWWYSYSSSRGARRRQRMRQISWRIVGSTGEASRTGMSTALRLALGL